MPSYPAAERDISAIVGEDTTWAALRGVIDGLQLEHIEAIEFVAVFRGPQIAGGRKSVTLRLRFRAPDKTLVHESIHVQVPPAAHSLPRAREGDGGPEPSGAGATPLDLACCQAYVRSTAGALECGDPPPLSSWRSWPRGVFRQPLMTS